MVDGVVAPGFERVRDAFERGMAEEIGAGFAAVRDGEVLVNIWAGWADRGKTRAWAADTLAPVHSTTKGVSSIVMAWLVDKGFVAYDDKLAAHWPAFAAHGKGELALAQVLSHQAGVPGFINPIDPQIWLDPPACADAIAALEPLWPPGSASGYHPQTWGYILGELTQRVAGRSLGTILREEICAPAGIDFFIGTPESEEHRAADVRKPSRVADFGEITPPRKAAFFTPWATAPKNEARWRRIEIPAANGHGTALAVAQLYEVFATGGEVGGTRVMSRETYAQLIAPRMRGADLVLPFEVDWRSGVLGNSNLFYGPNIEAIGHSGAGGSCGFGDPLAGIGVGYVMNKHSHHLMGDPRSLRLIEALYSCL